MSCRIVLFTKGPIIKYLKNFQYIPFDEEESTFIPKQFSQPYHSIREIYLILVKIITIILNSKNFVQ